MVKSKEMQVTPWEVEGRIEEFDYSRLIKQFGTQPLTKSLLEKIQKHTGELHFMLRRGIFFSHRDLDWLLQKYEKGEKFFLYTGRGPSGHTHIGHLVPWVLTKWLQEKFNAKLYFQLTDDEKFLFSEKLSLDDTHKLAYENALDLIALGFSHKDTFIFLDTDYAKTLYKEAIKVAKKLTFSTTKATFGFTNSSNVGQIFFTSIQAVPAFLPSVVEGKNIPCLIPLAVDQDAHFRVARDILPRLGYYKPSILHSTFMPGLSGAAKMSSSIPGDAIFTTDSPEVARKKVMVAFSGGAKTLKEHREKGGNPHIDAACQYLRFFFEENDKKVEDIFAGYRTGSLTSKEVKHYLADKVERFLKEHQQKREKAKKVLDKYLLKD